MNDFLIEIAAAVSAERGYDKLIQLQHDLIQTQLRLPETCAAISMAFQTLGRLF